MVEGKAEEADWSATRMTKNAQSKQGIESAESADIRCYQSQNAANVMEVPAGATIHYVSTQQVNHPGPTQYYLAKVPSGQSAATWDGSGAFWFKIHTTTPTIDANKQMTWPGQSMLSSLVLSCLKLILLPGLLSTYRPEIGCDNTDKRKMTNSWCVYPSV